MCICEWKCNIDTNTRLCLTWRERCKYLSKQKMESQKRNRGKPMVLISMPKKSARTCENVIKIHLYETNEPVTRQVLKQ